VDKFGTLAKATEATLAKAAELGLSVDFLKDTAAKSPTAFLKVMGVDTTQQANNGVGVSKTDINTQGFKIQGTVEVGTKAYYDKLRKEKPSEYFSATIQQQIMEKCQEGCLQGLTTKGETIWLVLLLSHRTAYKVTSLEYWG